MLGSIAWRSVSNHPFKGLEMENCDAIEKSSSRKMS